eukprot:GAFH01001637.1.p1 GENE.GAFH01001637.1~~GAFH01001637.1.p1  ORF type:complete len:461 (-),score=141.70 GAFH01001637.1:128-1318(-)
MPGLICAHTHFYSMFSRGMPLKDEPGHTFMEVLQRLWWRLDKALEAEDNYLSAAVSVLSAIRCGCTTVIDHHASPSSIKGSLDELARATLAGGIRACLCYEVTDRNGHQGAVDGIDENMRFIRRCATEQNPLLAAAMGLHASFTVTEDTLTATANALRRGAPFPASMGGIHIHVAEDHFDADHCMSEYRESPIQRLMRHGLLGERSLCSHCVHVSAADRALLGQTNTMVVHNPSSNMNNAVGLPAVQEMLSQGILLGLGTDGMSHDMVGEYKSLYLAHKLEHRNPQQMGGTDAAKMLFNNNAQIASRFFGFPIGVLAPGAVGDLVLLDYHNPTQLNPGNFPWHMMFGMSVGDVDTTIVAGKILMQGHRINPAVVQLNEQEIFARCRARCPGVWARF